MSRPLYEGYCPLESARHYNPLFNGIDEVVETALQMHDEAAEERLGDELADEASVIEAGMKAAPFDIPESEVTKILKGVEDCLKERRIGMCALDFCSYKDVMDAKLAELGIEQIKDDAYASELITE